MHEAQARDRFAGSMIARLATVGTAGPHIVPVTFVSVGDVVVFAVDHKPKSTRALRRLANIGFDQRVSFLVDVYDDRWENLWWVRADGTAEILAVTDARAAQAIDWLVDRYDQYVDHRPQGPVVWTDIGRWAWWSM